MSNPKLSYRTFEKRRLGGADRPISRIWRMFQRSFTAPTFGGFWRYWNPLFTFYLNRYVYKPVATHLPRSVALMVSFTVSGAIHDLFASLFLMRIYMLFTPVFFIWGSFVITEEWTGFTLRSYPPQLRIIFHLFILSGTIFGALFIRTQLGQIF